jgi:hypothetical protein
MLAQSGGGSWIGDLRGVWFVGEIVLLIGAVMAWAWFVERRRRGQGYAWTAALAGVVTAMVLGWALVTLRIPWRVPDEMTAVALIDAMPRPGLEDCTRTAVNRDPDWAWGEYEVEYWHANGNVAGRFALNAWTLEVRVWSEKNGTWIPMEQWLATKPTTNP